MRRVLLEEDSGVVLLLAEYSATYSAPLHLASVIINHTLILLMVGAPQGLDRHHGGRQDWVAAVVHTAVEAAALAQELPLVVKHISLLL